MTDKLGNLSGFSGGAGPKLPPTKLRLDAMIRPLHRLTTRAESVQ